MPADDFCELIEFAFEAETNEKLYARWIQAGQYSVGFEEFKRQLQPPKFKSDAELLADAKTIMDSMVGVKNTDGNI